jgi:hypothetical protein
MTTAYFRFWNMLQEPDFTFAAVRQCGHKQSPNFSRNSASTAALTFNESHQQGPSGAAQGNTVPHDSQVFCDGADEESGTQ